MLRIQDWKWKKIYAGLFFILAIWLTGKTIQAYMNYSSYKTELNAYKQEIDSCKKSCIEEYKKEVPAMLNDCKKRWKNNLIRLNCETSVLDYSYNCWSICHEKIKSKYSYRLYSKTDYYFEMTITYLILMILFSGMGVFLYKKEFSISTNSSFENQPLGGAERLKIISYFILMLAIPIVGWIMIFFTYIALYIKKVDKVFKPIENLEKIYIGSFTIAFLWSLAYWLIEPSHRASKNGEMFILIIFLSILAYIAYIIFFNTLKKHKKWVAEKGIFTNAKTS